MKRWNDAIEGNFEPRSKSIENKNRCKLKQGPPMRYDPDRAIYAIEGTEL
jgi:hypothetical protein